MIEKYNWKYIITFKKGSILTVYQEFEALLHLEPENRLTYWKKDIRQDYQWIKDIDHEGHLVNVYRVMRQRKIKRLRNLFGLPI